MNERRLNRRRLLVATGGTAVSIATLAGCLGEGDDGDTGDEDDTDNGADDGEDDGDDVVEVETRRGDEDEDEPSFVFDPIHVEVDPGTTIRWINTDGVFHTVTSTDSLDNKTPSGEFDATVSSEGDTFEWTPEEAGVQHYYCSPHAGFMDGTIEIGDVDPDEVAGREEENGDEENGGEENDDEEESTDLDDEEFTDMTGEDVVEVETRRGDDDEPEFVFDPQFITVDEGTTIEWVNTDGVFHTVTSSDSIDSRSGGDEFNATISSEGATFEWVADEAGLQPYYCSPHSGFMFGAIEIE